MIELITGIKSFWFWVVLQLNQSVPGKSTLISQEYFVCQGENSIISNHFTGGGQSTCDHLGCSIGEKNLMNTFAQLWFYV